MIISAFRVRFTEWQAFALDIPATDADRAIAIGRAIRDTCGTADFEEIDGGTDNWEAEPLDGPDAPQIDQLNTALTRLRRAAGKLEAAMDGATEEFSKERRRLAEALAAADLVLLSAKGGVS